MPIVGIGHSLGSCKYYRYKSHGSDPCKTKTQHKQFLMLLITLQAVKLPPPSWQPRHFHRALLAEHFNSNSFASVQHAFTLLKVAHSTAVSWNGKWSLFLCQIWHQHTCTQHLLLNTYCLIIWCNYFTVAYGVRGQRRYRPQAKLKSNCQLQLLMMSRISLVLPNMQVAVPTYCHWNWLSALGIDAGSPKVLNQGWQQCITGRVYRIS